MIMYLGDFAVGSTIYVPFNTFDKDDGSSITMTGFAVTDIEIYKNGSTTQRASDNGYTLLDTDGTDIDGITGIHGFSIDTADNTTSGFFTAGADYWVVVSTITVDSVTVSFVAAVFSIENRRTAGELIKTTIATLASQTSFTLTAGSADNSAYKNCILICSDQASGVQKCIGRVSAYTGSTKTVTLAADPAIFTMAAGDNISIIATSALSNVATIAGTAQTARDLGSSVLLSSGTGTGQVSLSSGAVTVGTNNDKTGYTASTVSDKTGYSLASGTQTFNMTGNITGNLSGSVGSVTGAVGSVTGAVGSVTGNVGGSVASVTGAVGSVTGNVGGSVASVTGAVGSVTGNVGGNVTGSVASVTNMVSANVTQISGDATAADNAESFFDGTGYAGTNNVIPTVTNVTNLHASAATSAELAKVPKSDSTVSWNATALAAINAEVDTALNTAIPGSPTSDSINERIATMDGRILGTIAAGTHNAQGGDAYARLGSPAGASVSADIADLHTDVADVHTDIGTIHTDIDSILADTNELQTDWANGGRLDLLLDGASAPSAATIADAVWNETLSDHLTGGSTGAGLNSASSAGDPWNTALPGAYSAGTAGKIIGDNVNATISSRSSHSAADVWSVATRTLTSFGTLVSDIWGAATRTLSSFGTLAADVWASTTRILTAATNITSDGGTISQTQLGRLDAAISTRSTVTEAQVNAQCDTAISDAALATAANLTTVDGIVDSIKSVTDKVDGMVVLDGAVYRYTANALELAPSSSGGDATAANQTTIIGHLTDIKGSTFSGSTDSLESIRDRGDAAWLTGGGGSGSNAISITVTDSTNPVQDVDVEIWDSGNTSFVTKNDTNASGVMTTNLNDGTYTVRMLKSGYTFTNRTLVVDGPETVSYSGSTVNIGTPSAPNVCRCYDYCMDLDGTPLTSVTATAQIMELPYDSGDELHIGTAVTGTYSNVTGLVYWDIVYGATVKFDIDEVGMTVKKVIPSSATGRITDMA